MNEPKIRFNGFEGEWEKGRIEEVAPLQGGHAFQSALFSKDGVPIVRISNILNSGEIGGTFIFYNGIVPSQFFLSKGDAVIAMSGATTGKTAVVKDNGFYYLNQRVGKFAHTGNIYYPFVATFIQSCYFASKLQNLLSSSAQPNISTFDVNSIQINVPIICEQQAIASYFTHLDTLITSSASRLSSLKQLKAASLQAMFPQEGETVPKIRFKGFEGEWEKVSLEKAFGFLKNNSLSRAELSAYGNVVNIHYGDVLIKYPDCLDVEKEDVTYVKDSSLANKLYKSCPLQKGDVIFADAAEDNTVGKCTELVNCNSPIISGLHTIPVRPLKSYASRYLGYYLNSPSYHNQLLVHIQGSKISSISKRALAQTLVVAPPSLPEQQAIASYFTSLDKQIALQSQRLEKLKQIKSACLDKMFA